MWNSWFLLQSLESVPHYSRRVSKSLGIAQGGLQCEWEGGQSVKGEGQKSLLAKGCLWMIAESVGCVDT